MILLTCGALLRSSLPSKLSPGHYLRCAFFGAAHLCALRARNMPSDRKSAKPFWIWNSALGTPNLVPEHAFRDAQPWSGGDLCPSSLLAPLAPEQVSQRCFRTWPCGREAALILSLLQPRHYLGHSRGQPLFVRRGTRNVGHSAETMMGELRPEKQEPRRKGGHDSELVARSFRACDWSAACSAGRSVLWVWCGSFHSFKKMWAALSS